MASHPRITSNFAHLAEHDEQLLRLAAYVAAAKTAAAAIHLNEAFCTTRCSGERPRELTRKQFRELALELDRAGFSETNLATAWREMTNQDIAARIVGFIRQAAVGDPLLPYEQRVDNSLQKMLASRAWTNPQRQWLQKIAAQTEANVIVDRDALDDPDLIFAREGGGFARLDRIFGGELQQILETFNESIWQTAA